MAEKVGSRCPRQLIPKVGVKVSFPEKRDIGISYCRFLLHDTMLKDDSHRTGTSDTIHGKKGNGKNNDGKNGNGKLGNW